MQLRGRPQALIARVSNDEGHRRDECPGGNKGFGRGWRRRLTSISKGMGRGEEGVTGGSRRRLLTDSGDISRAAAHPAPEPDPSGGGLCPPLIFPT